MLALQCGSTTDTSITTVFFLIFEAWSGMFALLLFSDEKPLRHATLYLIMSFLNLSQPGSQNGEQPSGHIGYNNFYQGNNPALGDATVDAIISWMTNSTHREIITAFSACNEPIFYNNADFQVLWEYYERTYEKLSTLEPPIPMMFAPGKPETPAM